MERTIRELILAIFMGCILPGILLAGAVKNRKEIPSATLPTATVKEEPVIQTSMRIHLMGPSEEGVDLELEEYLVGVVLGEMPASFEMEALKAQAVVARTYTLKCVQADKHGGGVCSDSGCCQAYRNPLDAAEEAVTKVREAVEATAGQVLTYNDQLIEATYFSCSGGVTEDAVAVWGTDYPYLRSVESPGEEQASHYTDTVQFTPEEFEKSLGQDLAGEPESWIGYATYTAGGGVNTMRIGGTEYKGTELRSRLGLRSTAFRIQADQQRITITTKGFGHRVGMSQYGAEAMAVAGSTYEDILAHYYQGTVLALFDN